MLVFLQSRHPCGEWSLTSVISFDCKNTIIRFLIKCRYISKFLNSVLKCLKLDSLFCLGDLALVHHYLCAPHLRNGPVSSVGPGFGLVYGRSGLRVDPGRGRLQVDASRRKLLAGGYDACLSIGNLLLMASKLRLHLSLMSPRFFTAFEDAMLS